MSSHGIAAVIAVGYCQSRKADDPKSALTARGWSRRRIARELGIDRGTVRKYLEAAAPKPAIPTTGSGAAAEANPAISSAGPDDAALRHRSEGGLPESLVRAVKKRRDREEIACRRPSGIHALDTA